MGRLVTQVSSLLAVLLMTGSLCAQPMSGTYTCANGNPGNGFDYGDIGAFFDDLESRGMAGPTTLDIYDDGGPFVSNSSYQLGILGTFGGLLAPTGLNLTNTLTLRAAAGESPEITGSGAASHFTASALGAMSFGEIGFTTIEGLTIRNAGFGLQFHTESAGGITNVRIAKCRIFNVDVAISFSGSGNSGAISTNITIENNMIWGCTGLTWMPFTFGIIGVYRCGPNWVIRHNTIVHDGSGISNVLFAVSGTAPVARFENNIVHLSGSYGDCWYTHSLGPPIIADGNVYHLVGTSVGVAPNMTPAQWQASGRDANGLFTDPLLMNVSPGFEDLYLQPASPARDLIPSTAVTIDIDGRPRPGGPGADAGAHEFYVDQELEVSFQTFVLGNQTTVPVGSVDLAGQSLQFSIRNAGIANLSLTSAPPVEIASFANCNAAVVQPATTTIVGLSSVTFEVFVDPILLGTFSLDLTIRSNDQQNDPFVITLAGTGAQLNSEAVATAPAGSSFTGPPNGPFVLAVDPGGGITNAEVELSDADGDAITVAWLNPPATLPMGVTGPTLPQPGQPLSLSWTGVADAANAPGTYSWTFLFFDAVNGNPVTCEAAIVINDLPPTHSAASAAGDGSFLNPYSVAFATGDPPAAGISLCAIADANVGQAHSVSAILVAGPPQGVGFQFQLVGGMVVAAPAAVLAPADIGTHRYDVFIRLCRKG